MRFAHALIFMLLLCFHSVVALNICEEDLEIKMIENNTVTGAASFLGNGTYDWNGTSFRISNCEQEDYFDRFSACLVNLSTCKSALISANSSLWSCGSSRCDNKWEECDASLDICVIQKNTISEDLAECNDELDDCRTDSSYNQTRYYRERYEDCIDAKNDYLTCGSDENDDCKEAWESCNDSISDYLDDKKEAESNLKSCGSGKNENCKSLWSQCSDNYNTCKSEKNSVSSSLNDCKLSKDNIQGLYDKCRSSSETSCEPVTSTQKQCMDCNQIVEAFKKSIGFNSTLGVLSSCEENKCEKNNFNSCSIPWVLVIFLFSIAMIIVISNISNLRKIKKESSEKERKTSDFSLDSDSKLFDEFLGGR